jgi:hypothetical protein
MLSARITSVTPLYAALQELELFPAQPGNLDPEAPRTKGEKIMERG